MSLFHFYSLFHAFDALGQRIGHKFWKDRRDMLPIGYKGGFLLVPYREIAPPPSDETAALILIRSVIERHVGRLEKLLAEHEEIEADEADERYDRAALDCSPAFERHPRYQSARHRELLRTLEAFRKLRIADFGLGNGEAEKADGKCQMADGKCQMADDGCRTGDDGCRTGDDRGQMADGKRQMPVGKWQRADDEGWITDDRFEMRSGGCGDGESDVPWPQAPSEEMAQEFWDLLYGESWPGSQATGIAGTPGGCGEGEPERSEPPQEECPAPEKAPNEAKLESTQSSLPLEVESSAPEPAGRKRSQFEGDTAARSTLHASRPQWPVNLEGVASGKWRREAVKKANPSAASRRQR
ncbi:MAG: hypothetical protein ABSH35_27835 [Isosphaeraceae bacterium]|jgi:hypothetical protein